MNERVKEGNQCRKQWQKPWRIKGTARSRKHELKTLKAASDLINEKQGIKSKY